MYYIYMLRCADNSLYTGITNDFKKRLSTHMSRDKSAAKYTRSHSVLGAVALWSSPDRSSATKLEHRIKMLTKLQKEELARNPHNVDSMGLEDVYKVIENF